MSSIWAPVIAALGASALTGLLTFGVQFWDRRREANTAHAAERRGIYLRLLTVTGLLITEFGYIQTLHGASVGRLKVLPSGQPTVSEIIDRINGPMRQLAEVSAEAWLHFDAEENAAVIKLLDAAQNIDLTLAVTDEKSGLPALGRARREFAEFARVRIGEAAITLVNIVPEAVAAPKLATEE